MVRAESFEALELREERNMNYQIEKERIVRSKWRGKCVIFFLGVKNFGILLSILWVKMEFGGFLFFIGVEN